MRCHSTRVPITAVSISQCRSGRRRRLPTVRRPRRSRIASAKIEAMTPASPAAITAILSAVGVVMKRVSTSMRAESPGWAGTFNSVKIPVT